MKQNSVLASLSLATSLMITTPAIAADYGITAALSDSIEIRIPIRVEGYVLEPYVSYYKSDDDTYESDDSSSLSSFGLGFWKTLAVAENVEAQVGLQAGFSNQKSTYSYTSWDDTVTENTTKYSGYTLAPGVGIFYNVSNNFQVGAEVKYSYQTLKVKYEDAENNGKINQSNTMSSVVARFYF